jgi:predicted pyridoxine 5'-phosphate oxidase superfamily flavin-nucleotide-binding protein
MINNANYSKPLQTPSVVAQSGGKQMDLTPFHADEVTAQQLARVHVTGAGIRPFMPDQHREFFAQLPYLFVSVPGQDGWPIATILSGASGFVRAPTPVTLRIDANASTSDPAASGFVVGNEIGILGLDLATRRRNRANGRIDEVDGRGFSVAVSQSFGNCAQYIQTRTIQRHQDTADASADEVAGLDAAGRRLIAEGDTFFVASRSRADAGRDGGLDMSHRGGRAGFVRVDGDALFIPDFKGNRFFNTLGNFLGDNRAGLLFVDFETGDLLQVTGRVTIDWSSGQTNPKGAQRLWRVDVSRSWWRRGALPFTWNFGTFARETLTTGVW